MWIFACTPECDEFRRLCLMLSQQQLFASLFMKNAFSVLDMSVPKFLK